MNSYILQTHHLSKTMRGKEIVSHVDLHVKKGEIYGFLGPNGAGKTTIMKMITNLWKPTGGTIELFGETLTPTSYGVLKRMGSMIEFPTFYERLSGKENLRLHCEYMGYYQTGSVEKGLDLLGLPCDDDKAVRSYSLGMKQRLGIARAILCRPELLILDEPTNGLDPSGMKQVRELMRMLCHEYGVTILVSSHILSEIESVADTIGILHQGVLQKEVSMQAIEAMNTDYIDLEVEQVKRAAYVLSDRLGLNNFKMVGGGKIRIYDQGASTQALMKTLMENEVAVVSIGRRAESLEDYFLKLTEEAEKGC